MTQQLPEAVPGSRFLDGVIEEPGADYLPRHLGPADAEPVDAGPLADEPEPPPVRYEPLPAPPALPVEAPPLRSLGSFPAPGAYSARRAAPEAPTGPSASHAPRFFRQKVDPARLMV